MPAVFLGAIIAGVAGGTSALIIAGLIIKTAILVRSIDRADQIAEAESTTRTCIKAILRARKKRIRKIAEKGKNKARKTARIHELPTQDNTGMLTPMPHLPRKFNNLENVIVLIKELYKSNSSILTGVSKEHGVSGVWGLIVVSQHIRWAALVPGRTIRCDTVNRIRFGSLAISLPFHNIRTYQYIIWRHCRQPMQRWFDDIETARSNIAEKCQDRSSYSEDCSTQDSEPSRRPRPVILSCDIVGCKCGHGRKREFIFPKLRPSTAPAIRAVDKLMTPRTQLKQWKSQRRPST